MEKVAGFMQGLAKGVNECYNGRCGFPQNYAEAWIGHSGNFCLRIGGYDIEVAQDGRFIGSGGSMCLLQKFKATENQCPDCLQGE